MNSRTDILWRPHNNHASLSLAAFDDHPSSTEDSGRTLSVMTYIVVSVVTASMNLRTSGCRIVRNFFNALFARGRCFFCGFEAASNSNTDTGDPSSYRTARADVRHSLESPYSRASLRHRVTISSFLRKHCSSHRGKKVNLAQISVRLWRLRLILGSSDIPWVRWGWSLEAKVDAEWCERKYQTMIDELDNSACAACVISML